MKNILIVDDERSILDTFSMFFESLDFNVYSSETYKDAVEIISTKNLQVIITDLKLGYDKTGLDILTFSKKHNSTTQVILITAFASKETAFEATKLGIYDYIIKPVHLDTLDIIVNRALQKNELLSSIKDTKKESSSFFCKALLTIISKVSRCTGFII